MSTMKILYFAYAELDTPSACQTHTLGVLGGFAANGCQVDAVVAKPIWHRWEIPSVRFHYISCYNGKRRYLLREIPYSTAWLIYLCLRESYDAIYARDMDVFIGPRLCSQMFRIPLYLEIDDTPVEGNWPRAIRRIVEQNLRRDYMQAAGLIVPSVPRCRLIQEKYGVPAHRIHMILNGTEAVNDEMPARAEVKKRLGLPTESFCLGYVGTLTERYDFDTLLSGMVKCRDNIPHLYLIVVGHGSMFSQIKQKVQTLGLAERVIFTGFLQQDAFSGVLPAMDIGFMSLRREALMEHGPIHTKLGTYATFRLPVVTAGLSLEGYPEEIRHGVLLVPPEDDESLARTILWLHENPLERRRISDFMYDYVMRRLTWKAVTADILRVMKKS